jgi:hypothetical protein
LGDGYNYKKGMLGKDIVQVIHTLSNKMVSIESSFVFGEMLLQNCIISAIPYDPFSEFSEEKYFCFVVFFILTC